jgi:16S rRNA processing protein RimM
VKQSAEPPYIAIARIVRSRGNRGEVLAELHTDFPERFTALHEVWLRFPDRRRERYVLERVWMHNGRPVLKFAAIDSISDAERLVGAWVEVDAAAAVPLPEGTYFDHDLIGCRVLTASGECLGRVKEVVRIPGNFQFLVAGEGGEFMVPAREEFCKEISTEERRIVVDLPQGLIDLNE